MNSQFFERPTRLLLMAAGVLYGAAIAHSDDSSGTSAANTNGGSSQAITIRALDPDGKPVSGAKVGDYAFWEQDVDLPEMHGLGDPREDIEPQVTDANGACTIDAATVAKFQDGPHAVYAIAAERELVGLADLSKPDTSGVIEIAMVPWCMLKVSMDSTELARIGQPFELGKGYIYWQKARPFFGRSTKEQLRFLLPSGKYELNAYGSKLVLDSDVEVEIAPGQRSKAIDVDLPVSRLAYLIGHPAPELDHVARWKYSKPAQLTDLRGKIVLLEFWGTWCGPCVASMPKLIGLYHEFHDRGLEVIAVHTASKATEEEMDERLTTTAKKYWGGAELPFPVAIDGGADRSDPVKAYGATTAEYGISSWPTAILINRQGNVVGDFDYRGETSRESLIKILGIADKALDADKPTDVGTTR
jgi:thiol-disulfide isomerase/thioredoxin